MSALREVEGLAALLVGHSLAALGGSVIFTAALWQGYRETQSPLVVAVVISGSGLATLVGFALGGVLADRHDPRRIILAVRGPEVLCGLLLAAQAMWASGLGILIATCCVLATLVGVSGPAAMCLLSTMTGTKRRVEGFALWTTAGRVAQAAGPLVGGVLLGGGGPQRCYVAGAILVGLAAAALCWVPPTARFRSGWTSGGDGAPRPSGEDVSPAASPTVWSVIASRPAIQAAIALDTAVMLAASPFAVLPALAEDRLHIGPEGFGVVMAAPAVGALVGLGFTRWVGRLSWLKVTVVGSCIWCVCVALLGVTSSAVVAVVALVVAGGGDLWSESARSSAVNEAVPDAVRGRVLSVWLGCASVAPVFGALLMGAAASAVGAPGALAGGGGIGVLCVLLLGLWWFRRDRPSEDVHSGGKPRDPRLPPQPVAPAS